MFPFHRVAMNGNTDHKERPQRLKQEEALKDTVTPELFYFSIAKIAVAQICQTLGFNGSQNSALNNLSSIATRYLQTLAKYAATGANSSGRTTCNAFDVIHAIEHINSAQGFAGLSNANQPLLNSGIIKEIIRFVRCVDEIPFAKPIPRRNYPKRLGFSRSVAQSRSHSHIPAWVPNFPDRCTYEKSESKSFRAEMSQFLEALGESMHGDGEKGSDLERQEEGKNMGKKKRTATILPAERETVKIKLGKEFRKIGQ